VRHQEALQVEKERELAEVLAASSGREDFRQLSLLLHLQRFLVPHPLPEQAATKWKSVLHDGAFAVRSVASLTVVIPWYRYCQMERTSRWAADKDSKWDNRQADGPYVDVPTANIFAALLSADPPPAPDPKGVRTLGGLALSLRDGAISLRRNTALPPKQLLLVDLHECVSRSWLPLHRGEAEVRTAGTSPTGTST